jgi:penicillin-binding protein 2
MIDPVSDRRIPLPPQLAVRVAVLGVIGFALFAIVFFRLWYLQVLSGEQYLRQAQVNRIRTERIPAPRGSITDRNGKDLVVNEQATVITLDPSKLPDSEKALALQWGNATKKRLNHQALLQDQRDATVARLRKQGHRGKARTLAKRKVKLSPVAIPQMPAQVHARFTRLGKIIGMKAATIQQRVILGLWLAPYAPAKIKTGVPDDVRDYLYERPEQFPGVVPQSTYLRKYPFKNLAAQIFGTIGSISQPEIDSGAFKGAPGGTVVGQDGLERRYDADLRGRDGIQRFLVDAQGNPKGLGKTRAPSAGRSLKLTLDAKLQQTGQDAMLQSGGGLPSAFVAMNPNTGAIYALGSYPSFDPNELSKPITPQKYQDLFSAQAGSPLFNRAITGGYPTGSTFKPFTALAALNYRDPKTGAPGLTLGERIASPPCVQISTVKVCNAGSADLGNPDLVEALKISADIFFYQLGAKINPQTDIQQWARKLGLGHTTGVDLPGENGGTIPDKTWRAKQKAKEIAYEKAHKVACCTISDKRPWSIGDNVNLATGQGDVQATPLQMATAYAALANGGKVVTPHLGAQVDDDQGRVVREISAGASRKVNLDPNALAAIHQGLLDATSQQGGTSYKVFAGSGWNESQFPVYGKTGTAQRPPHNDQSWFVCWSKDTTGKYPPIVIAATVEDAGFGADYAAPAVRLMLAEWFHQTKAAKLIRSQSTTR